MIQGGTAPNVVPGKAVAALDFRFLPGQTAEQFMQRLRELARALESEVDGARFEFEILNAQPATEVSRDNELVRVISRTAQEVTGREVRLTGMSGATVTKQLITRGVTAVGFSVGDADMAHMADESIDLEDLVQYARIIALVAVRLLGTK